MMPSKAAPEKKSAFSTLYREALIASGLTSESLLTGYMEKLDRIHEQIASELKITTNRIKTARALFDWLWAKKPYRYQIHGPFKLHHVVDAQMSESASAVGNCLGLTLLYNCLLKRSGIQAEAIYIEDAFDIGPHVFSYLIINDHTIDVENILPDGFDYQGHLHNPTRRRWNDRELVADIYVSLGNECFEKGELTDALKNYENALDLNPEYEKAYLNKIIVMGMLNGTKR